MYNCLPVQQVELMSEWSIWDLENFFPLLKWHFPSLYTQKPNIGFFENITVKSMIKTCSAPRQIYFALKNINKFYPVYTLILLCTTVIITNLLYFGFKKFCTRVCSDSSYFWYIQHMCCWVLAVK